MIFFWTDILFFLLLLMLAGAIVRARSKEHLRRPWRKVARSRSAMVSLTVLVFYLAFAVLDSVHFRPSDTAGGDSKFKTEAMSLLDWWANPLRQRVEKTYSAPFAVHAYARENIRGADGVAQRVYPRLQYGGAHLKNPEQDKAADILLTVTKGLAEGVLVWSVLTLALALGYKHTAKISFAESCRMIACGHTDIPWRSVFLTVLLLLLAGFSLGECSLKYHVFGTDKVGEDVFFQSLKSIRTGLLIGTLTTFVTLPLALVLGIMAGYFRGWVDDVIQYVYTTLNSIPGVLLIAASMLLMQAYMARHEAEFASLALRADFRLLFLCMILGLTSWTGLCRLLRAETLKLREMEYVQAARALGTPQG
ncbi:MAG: ABC transporter permease, partial [Candidatus Methylumidiphilus sp.]